MVNRTTSDKLSRRKYLLATGGTTAAMVGLAGCSSSGGSNKGTTTSTSSQGTTASTTTSSGTTTTNYKPLTVQTWWTGPDGGPAIKALYSGFEKTHPNIKIKRNPVSGSAGQNLKSVIKKRILNHNPPGTWQAWPGKHLMPYVKANMLEDIESSVWDHNNMKKAYQPGVQKAAKPGGKYVCVPLDVNRLNNLFYNISVVEKAGVKPKSIKKPSDLVGAMKQIEQNTDAVGMAQASKAPWPTLQLWVEVLLGEHGYNTYKSFYKGNTSGIQSEMKNAFSIVKEYHNYWNKDTGSITETTANKKVINGKAAFIHQGSWIAGPYYHDDSFNYGKQWNQVSFPGTDGLYVMNLDSFPFPKGDPAPNSATEFLRYAGSVDGQKRFNPPKGAIPPRTDVPKASFHKFEQDNMKDYKNSRAQPLSTTHGLATTPQVRSKLLSAVTNFLSSWDPAQATKAFSKAV